MKRSTADGESVAGRMARLRQVQFCSQTDKGSIHWVRTLLARRDSRLRREHLRFKPVLKSVPNLHCVLLDCSASMLSAGQLAAAKGVLLDLSEQVYRRRDSLAVISFAGNKVQLLHDPHKVGASALGWIKPIAGGGGSPIQLALQSVEQLMRRQQLSHPDRHRVLWVLSDGRYDPLPDVPRHVHECHVVDFESGFLTLGRVKQLAELWQAQYTPASQWASVGISSSLGSQFA